MTAELTHQLCVSSSINNNTVPLFRAQPTRTGINDLLIFELMPIGLIA